MDSRWEKSKSPYGHILSPTIQNNTEKKEESTIIKDQLGEVLTSSIVENISEPFQNRFHEYHQLGQAVTTTDEPDIVKYPSIYRQLQNITEIDAKYTLQTRRNRVKLVSEVIHKFAPKEAAIAQAKGLVIVDLG